MSKRSMRIIAYIALVFMALGVASLIAWSFDRTLFNGAIGTCAIVTGGTGIALYVVLMLVRRAEARKDAPERDRAEPKPEEPTQPEEPAELVQPDDENGSTEKADGSKTPHGKEV